MTNSNLIAIDAGAHRARVIERRDELIALTMRPGRLSLVERIARETARRLPSCFDIEDLIGVGQIALLQAATRYRPERGAWLTYARLVVYGAIIESVRRKHYPEQARPGLELVRPKRDVVADATVAEALDRQRAADRVRAAMACLPADQRIVLEEFYSPWEPTLAEVAERLGRSLATVHARRKKALAALRRRLKTAGWQYGQ